MTNQVNMYKSSSIRAYALCTLLDTNPNEYELTSMYVYVYMM